MTPGDARQSLRDCQTTPGGISLLGRHLLGEQFESLLRHENVECRVYSDVLSLLESAPRHWPVLLWSTNNRQSVFDAMQLRLRGYRAVRYWVGSDVLRLAQMKRLAGRSVAFLNRLLFDRHLTNSPWLSTELEPLGLCSTPLPVSPVCCGSHWPMTPFPPLPYRVIYYSLPDNDQIYLPDVAEFCAQSNPEISLVCIGHPEVGIKGSNVMRLGVLGPHEMRRIYETCHCLLRFTSHDGMPRSVLEALGNGLDVVTNLNIPHVVRVASQDEAAAALRSLCRARQARNLDGREWVLAQHSAESFAGRLAAELGPSRSLAMNEQSPP